MIVIWVALAVVVEVQKVNGARKAYECDYGL